MNLKTISYYFFIALGVMIISACGKENIDTTDTDPDDLNPVVVTCELTLDLNEAPPFTLNATAAGGTEPYTYMWSNEATTNPITVNAPGDYSVTVTDSEGCTITQTITATGDGGDPCSTFIGGTELDNDMIVAYATGGTPPYSYLWYGGETTNSIPAVQDYIVTVMDAEGCSFVVIAGSPCPNFFCQIEEEAGMLTTTVTGGTQPYTYEWSTGEMTANIQTNAPGEYTVIVSDADFCSAVQTFTVTGGGNPCDDFTLDLVLQMNTLTIAVAGGTAPYSYAWSNGATTGTIDVVPGETYTVIVTDANGCNLTETITIGASNCNDFIVGYVVENYVITLNATGGTLPYLYEWSTGETTDAIIVNAPGLYTVVVTDSMGCIIVLEIEVN